MTTLALFVAAMAFVVAPAVWLMIRVNRANERKMERIREEWEAGGREKPWTWDVFRGGDGSP
jgi:hypothetical protein